VCGLCVSVSIWDMKLARRRQTRFDRLKEMGCTHSSRRKPTVEKMAVPVEVQGQYTALEEGEMMWSGDTAVEAQ
jgi:hypothetical protein